MTKPIGYFTDCSQGNELARMFGDGNLAQLPKIDQAALLVSLSGFVLSSFIEANRDGVPLSIEDAANEFIPEDYGGYKRGDIFDAIAILRGINVEDANNIIHFLTQSN